MNVLYGVGMIFACLLLFPIRPAMGGCKDIYPDAQVMASMSKPDYTACKLETMKLDYAEVLLEQVRLLDVMLPVYQRYLETEAIDGDQQRGVRLNEYSAKMQNLQGIATALQAVVIVPESGEGGEVGGTTGAEGRVGIAAITELIDSARKHSQTLTSKISATKDLLKNSEKVEFCKLDFKFRIHNSLHKKMADCINGGG